MTDTILDAVSGERPFALALVLALIGVPALNACGGASPSVAVGEADGAADARSSDASTDGMIVVTSPEGGAAPDGATADADHPDATGSKDGEAGLVGDAADEGAPHGCPTGDLLCGGACVPSNPHNCGACGNDCTHLAHVVGATSCTAGTCSIPASACAAGWADCNGKPDDGCETDITQPATCGSCTTACPATDPVCAPSSSGYACVTGCAPATPTLCGGACVDTTSNVNDCGGCAEACPAPTGGAGQPTCAAGTCTLACTGATSLACSGACVDPTLPAHCGTCTTQCSAAPSGAGTATCNGTTCGLACAPGFQVVGADCSPMTDVYVSVSSGNDANPGTLAAPVKTITRALGIAQGSATVQVSSGTYSESSGPSQWLTVPDGVTVESYNGTVTVSGPGEVDSGSTIGFAFMGSGTVRGITVQDYDVPFLMDGIGGAVGGSQLLDTVNTVQNARFLGIGGTAQTTIVNSTLGPVYVGTSASVSIQSGTITAGGTCNSSAWFALQAQTTGSVTVMGVTIQAIGAGIAVLPYNSASGTTRIMSSTVTGPCAGIQIYQGASLELDDDTVTGTVANGGGALTISGGTFTGSPYAIDANASLGVPISIVMRDATIVTSATGLGLGVPGTYDLGTAQSPGGNTLRSSPTYGELVLSAGVTVFAAGNTWNPSVQGADASGHFVSGTKVTGPMSCPPGGCNFSLADATDSVIF